MTGGEDSEYFIGSIVVCGRPDGVLEVIDGQQRVTTVYLTLCAMRNHLKELGNETAIQELAGRIASADMDAKGNNVFRYRVILQYEDSCGALEQLAAGEDITKLDASTRSLENLQNAYRMVRGFLNQEFGQDVAELKRFYFYLTRKVKLIRVQTASVAHALKVFETINDRGVGLDSMDLLKNLMFMQASRGEFDKLMDKWKQLVDLLHQAKEKPLRFLRYFIFSRYEVDRLREDEIYDWFVKHADVCGYKDQPLTFVDQLRSAAEAYVRFRDGVDVDGTPNRYLANIGFLSGMARQHLILLMAGQHLPRECRTELSRQIENLFFAFIITREPTRKFEQAFAHWAPRLRKVRDRKELDQFVDTYLRPTREGLAQRFALAFRDMQENSVQKYRLRYILAKLTQHVDEQARGSTGAEVELATYVNKKVWVEHILPQSPTQQVIEAFDQPELIGRYIRKLGNLTLLESSINSSVGNGLFEEKKQAFCQSKFLLTRALGEKMQVGVNTAIDRAVRDLEAYAVWSSAAIDRRQSALMKLACQVWDMPQVDVEEDSPADEADALVEPPDMSTSATVAGSNHAQFVVWHPEHGYWRYVPNEPPSNEWVADPQQAKKFRIGHDDGAWRDAPSKHFASAEGAVAWLARDRRDAACRRTGCQVVSLDQA